MTVLLVMTGLSLWVVSPFVQPPWLPGEVWLLFALLFWRRDDTRGFGFGATFGVTGLFEGIPVISYIKQKRGLFEVGIRLRFRL